MCLSRINYFICISYACLIGILRNSSFAAHPQDSTWLYKIYCNYSFFLAQAQSRTCIPFFIYCINKKSFCHFFNDVCHELSSSRFEIKQFTILICLCGFFIVLFYILDLWNSMEVCFSYSYLAHQFLEILSIHISRILVLVNRNHKRKFLRLSWSRIGLYSLDYPLQTSEPFWRQLQKSYIRLVNRFKIGWVNF